MIPHRRLDGLHEIPPHIQAHLQTSSTLWPSYLSITANVCHVPNVGVVAIYISRDETSNLKGPVSMKSRVSEINETRKGDTCSICVLPMCLAADLRSIYAQRAWH
jgi:hypothetical protein